MRAAEASATEAETETGSTVKVLHVDDEPDFAEMVSRFLERENDDIQVVTETCAEDARRRLGYDDAEGAEGADGTDAVDIDCVVSDYSMPGKDGIELLEEVRESHPDLPFLLFTGKGSEEVASEAISAGVTDYLQKETGTEQYAVLANRVENAVRMRRSERGLRESRKRLDMLFEQSPLGAVEWDDDFRLVRMNERAEEILGYEEEELEGETWEVVVPESDEQEVAEIVESLLENKGGYHSVNENVTKEGERIVCEWHNRVVTGESGETVAVISLFQDITGAEERERELERYEAFVENTSDLVTLVDEDGTILYQSPSVERVLGYGADEAVGVDVFELVHPDDKERVREEFSDFVDDPETEMEETEYRYLRSDGRYVWLEGSVKDLRDTALDGILVVAREVTERKEREEELSSLKERLDLAVEGANLGIWDWNVKTDEVRHNDRWAEMLGLSPDETGSGFEFWEKRLHPDDMSETREKLQRHLEGEMERYEAEYRMRTADGDWKWIRTVGQVVERDDDGYAERAIGTHMDITDRKEREKELERYESFIENSSDVVTHVDEEGTILYQSPSVERVFGYEQGETVGDNAFDYMHPDDREEMVEEFYDVLQGPEKTVDVVEYRLLNADGDYVWVEAVGSDHTDTEAGGFVVNLRDITERKMRQEELERYEAFIENSSDIITHLHEDGTVLYVSPSVERILGYEPHGIIGDNTFDYVHPEDRDRIFDEFVSLLTGPDETAEDVEFRMEHADGGYVWLEVTATDQTGTEVGGVVVNSRDITERKRYEEELVRNQELLRNTERIADTGGWDIDAETEEVRWTEGMYDIFDVPDDYKPTLEDAIEAYHPDDRGTARRGIERCLEEGKSFDEELRIIAPENEYLWLRVRAKPVREDGKITGIRGSVRDITDRKERETELLRNNMAVRSLYETTADPDLSFDDKVEMVLESCRNRLGLQYAFVTEIDPEAGTQTITHARGDHELLQPGESCPLEKSYCAETVRGEGLLTVREAVEDDRVADEAYDEFGLGCYVGAKLTVDGEMHGTLCLADTEPREEPFTDFEKTLVELIAKWVSYELERERSNERLRRQKERLDDFASVVSHDLRSPLTVIMGNLELAEETGDPTYFESCRGAIERMESMMDDLLSLSRNVDEIQGVEEVDLAQVVEESWRSEDRKEAELVVGTEARILADEGKLRLLLDNLLRNSVEHGGEDVTVTVSDLPNGFRLEDDGAGIPEEERERVLEAGYSTREGGTGMGMYIVEQVAEAHGWDICVTEGDEGGAAFEVTGVETATVD